VTTALATLPWVEADSIRTDQDRLQVKFTVKDRAKYNFEDVKRVLAKAGYDDGAKALAGPTDQ
jgi:maltoporin